MQAGSKGAGVPLWVKILLVAGILMIVCTVGLIAWGTLFFKNLASPEHTRDVLHSFATVKEPLPTGFEYQIGLDVMGTKMVGIQHAPDLIIFIGQLEDRTLTDPQEAIDKMSTGTGNAKGKLTVKQRGEQTVGGRQMSWAMGELSGNPGVDQSTRKTFIGLFPPTKAGKVVCVLGECLDNAGSYNMHSTINELLSAIAKI